MQRSLAEESGEATGVAHEDRDKTLEVEESSDEEDVESVYEGTTLLGVMIDGLDTGKITERLNDSEEAVSVFNKLSAEKAEETLTAQSSTPSPLLQRKDTSPSTGRA